MTVYRKAHLWDRERLVFSPGNELPPVISTRLVLLAICICYDLEFPEWVATRLGPTRGRDQLTRM
jgi:predicted amidohydrolase